MHNSSLRWKPKLCPRYCHSGTAQEPPEAAGCSQLRWLSADMNHEQDTLLPILDLFINEGIRNEGNLLSERGLVVKTMLTCLSIR